MQFEDDYNQSPIKSVEVSKHEKSMDHPESTFEWLF